MGRLLAAFCLGVMAATLMPDAALLRSLLLAGLALCGVLAACCHIRCGFVAAFPCSKALALVSALMIGALWHAHWAQSRLQERLPSQLEGVDLSVIGRVVSMPRETGLASQVEFHITEGGQGFRQRTVRLNDYQQLGLKPGQHWRLQIRLKRSHGRLNPGGFDAESWTLQNGIAATGYIRAHPDNRLLKQDRFGIEQLRQALQERLLRASEGLSRQGIVLALVLGERSALGPQQRDFFSRTGVSHLFVISGLHIGLVALLGYAASHLVFRLAPGLAGVLPRQRAGAILALAAALGYSLLAGFSLPTQRAVVMIGCLMLGHLLQRPASASLRLLLALALVLILNPLATASAGFWLSFVAVAALLAAASPPRSDAAERPSWLRRGYRNLVHPQWVVFLALALPLALWMQQLSLLAPLINVVAIPIVGFLVVPLCLGAAVLVFHAPALAVGLLHLVEWILNVLFGFMAWLLELGAGVAVLTISEPGLPASLLAVLAVLLLLAPRGVGYRLLAAPLALPLVLPQADALSQGAFEAHVLDVGQGLAVVLRTANHNLLYDTGPGFDEEFNSGASIIAPTLRHLGIRRLHKVVVSHGDNDHAGGLPGVLRHIPVDEIHGEVSPALPATPCLEGVGWRWDGVDFRFLHPPDGARQNHEHAGNERSCVLLVSSAAGRLLLPGDIDTGVERRLALDYGDTLQADVLVAPHHGSNTSSSHALLKLARPGHVVFTAGYRNRFGHPAQEIQRRYREFGSKALTTSATGMVSFRFAVGDRLDGPRCHRQRHPRYWRDSPPACP